MFDDRKKKSACLQFLRWPECYNKLLLSRAGEDEGRRCGEEAGAKRPENLKDRIRTQAKNAPGVRRRGRGRGEGGVPGRRRRKAAGTSYCGAKRAAGAGRTGPAGAGRCSFKAGGAGRPSAAVIGAAGSLAPLAGPGGVGWSPLRFDKVLATQ